MKLGSERAAGFWTSRPPALEAVLVRLESLSRQPAFALQREIALARTLRPYLGGGVGRIVAPLAQETDLADLSVLCDFYPEDGQLTLIEQLRDVITEHIPDEERQWLDPLKHSYLDLLELTVTPKPGETLMLRSLGDQTSFVVPGVESLNDAAAGQVLLARVVRTPVAGESGGAVWSGGGLILSPADAKALLEITAEWRREMEISSGSFALGEWGEFAKRFGHMLLWAFAQLRMDALVDAVVHILYRRPDGQPYLYAMALYDHHEYRFFVDGLTEISELEEEKPPPLSGSSSRAKSFPPARTWVQRDRIGESDLIVVKVTLTSSQLMVECDGPERLDRIKHRLAATFGFSLHFRGETATPPVRRLSVAELRSEEPVTVVVTKEEDCRLLNQFLEKAYLEWSDQPHLELGRETPRHAAASPALRAKVVDLIEEMEQHDLGRRRCDQIAFNYDRLRGQVGVEEQPG
ncbi:MAG: hypothetical protein CV090_12285 [Nitrospira sp. WS238]|nr:hypothetical protein [Nitrospira sp. WS238]